jgi:hypothetical protein
MIHIYTDMAWETCPQTPQLHRPRFMSFKKSKLVLLPSNLCSRGESPSLSLSATARKCWKLRVLRIAVLGLRKFQTTLVATSCYVKHPNLLSMSKHQQNIFLVFHIRIFFLKILCCGVNDKLVAWEFFIFCKKREGQGSTKNTSRDVQPCIMIVCWMHKIHFGINVLRITNRELGHSKWT